MVLRICTLLLLAGCLKQPSAVTSGAPVPVALGAVLTGVDDGVTTPAATEVMERLSAVVSARALTPKPASGEALAVRPNSASRVSLLAEGAEAGGLLVLVESSARFFSQMNGRFRWTVEVKITLAPGGEPDHSVVDSFEVPVFLQFNHEGEDEALREGLPVIERRLGALLDSYLLGLAAAKG